MININDDTIACTTLRNPIDSRDNVDIGLSIYDETRSIVSIQAARHVAEITLPVLIAKKLYNTLIVLDFDDFFLDDCV